MKAIISHNLQNRQYGLPETVETVDITVCLVVLKHLSDLAKLVNDNPSNFDNTSQLFAYLIRQVEAAIDYHA